MISSTFFFVVFRFFLPPVIIVTTYLYVFYPFFHLCSFPDIKAAEAACYIPGQEKPGVPAEIAPFRLLVFADPQLEGSSSLPDPSLPKFPSLGGLGRSWNDGGAAALPAALSTAVTGLVTKDVPRILWGYRKRVDLWGNDLYLAHVYRYVHWWSNPTHTTVLGDLMGSQWMNDAEFGRRSRRFWKKVFRGATKVPHNVTDVSGRVEVLGNDPRWKRRLIAVAGNHDIGYAGDINEHRIRRFEETFGSVNWEIRFRLDGEENNEKAAAATAAAAARSSSVFGRSMFDVAPPEIRLIILNTMNLDNGALVWDLQKQSREFVAEQLHSSIADTPRNAATVLLTHIPLHKEAGVCVDSPFFKYFPQNEGGGIKEQNHLSPESSEYIITGLIGDKKHGRAILLNGHDHEGCDTYHFRNPASDETETPSWTAKRYNMSVAEREDESIAGLREITVRSMMAEYDGHVGFLSAWFDKEEGQWQFRYDSCQFWFPQAWWGMNGFIFGVLFIGLVGLGLFVKEVYVEIRQMKAEEAEEEEEEQEKQKKKKLKRT